MPNRESRSRSSELAIRGRRKGAAHAPAPLEAVRDRIMLIRGQKVLLDSDLARFYAVPTKVLNQSVRRNADRFPEDFMFQLTPQEAADLRSQSVTATKGGPGGRRTRPLAFTEQGVAMLSGVLRSPRAISVNIAIMRAFVHVRQLTAQHADLRHKIDELEIRYDQQFAYVFQALRSLLEPAEEAQPARTPIGFRPPPDHPQPDQEQGARGRATKRKAHS